ncbi:MAG TPA: hypothetical protein VK203_29515 [Nostocaceae cyanobacterium]|nr:hypothetical protein [Nostocaceae cyanobacterium]
MKKQVFTKLIYFIVINILLLGNLPKISLRQKNFNFSLIVGEWSEKGKCNSSRYVFTKDGRYQSLFREKGRWNLFFNGNYTRRNYDSLTISHTNDNNESFEDVLQVYNLSSTELSGKWFISIEDDTTESFSWQRCTSRR